jgi:mRNA interferase MazF
MKQGDVWKVDLNPVKGSEQNGIRPVVVISGNAMNDNLGISIVCPLTTKVKNYAGCVVLKKDFLNGLSLDSEVITFQIRAISRERFIEKLGVITNKQLSQIKKGLNDILTY